MLKKIAFLKRREFTFLNKRTQKLKVLKKNADIYSTKAKSIEKSKEKGKKKNGYGYQLIYSKCKFVYH